MTHANDTLADRCARCDAHDGAPDAPDLLAALERAEALLSVPDNGACVCRWCHADRLEPHAEHCWFDERRRAVLAAQDAARAAIAKARGTR